MHEQEQYTKWIKVTSGFYHAAFDRVQVRRLLNGRWIASRTGIISPRVVDGYRWVAIEPNASYRRMRDAFEVAEKWIIEALLPHLERMEEAAWQEQVARTSARALQAGFPMTEIQAVVEHYGEHGSWPRVVAILRAHAERLEAIRARAT